jgi:magnesium-transporting ATPase (P-type)
MWHAISWEEAVQKLQTDPVKGLSEDEVKKRRNTYGRNVLPEEKLPSQVQVFARQFKNPLILILLFAGSVTLFLAKYTDSIVILGAMLINALIGYTQEQKATKALSELRKVLT